MSTIDYEKLIAALDLRGVSRRRLAQELDVSRSTIMRILSGKHRPSYFTANGIAEVLDLSGRECLEIFFPRYAASGDRLDVYE